MPVFKVQIGDGTYIDVEAPNKKAASAALREHGLKVLFIEPKGGSSTDSAAVGEFTDKAKTAGKGFALGASQGATLGFADEGYAGARSLMGGDYDEHLGRARDALATAREEAPFATNAGEIAGALGTGLTAFARLPAAVTGRGRFVQGLGIGTTEGTLAGLGTGEGQEDRVQRAKEGAAVGGTIGGAAAPASALLGRGITAVKERMKALLGSGSLSEQRAKRMLAGAMRQAKMSDEHMVAALEAAQREGQDVFTVADALGIPGQRLVRGLSRGDSDASREIQDYLETRQAGQGERVSDFFGDAVRPEGTAAEVKSRIQAATEAQAEELYGKARAAGGTVDTRVPKGVIMRRLDKIPKGTKIDPVSAKLQPYLGQLTRHVDYQEAPDDALRAIERSRMPYEHVLSVHQGMGDAIAGAGDRGNLRHALGSVYHSLGRELDQANEFHRAASDAFKYGKELEASVDAGKVAARPSTRGSDVAAEFRDLEGAKQGAYRAGFADPVMSKVENAHPGINTARQFTTPAMSRKIEAMSTDPSLFARRIGREMDMARTRDYAAGGSPTAQALADVGEIESGSIVRAARSPMSAVADIAAAGIDRLRGLGSEDFRNALGSMLMARGATAEQAARRAGEIWRMDDRTKNRILRALAIGGTAGAVHGAQ